MPLDLDAVSGLLPRGGTILGTSRTNPFKDPDGGAQCAANFRALGLDALVAIGGEDTLGVAAKLTEQFDVPCVGVPKTIDNDLDGTDYTFGFSTAVQIATDAIDRLHTHRRVPRPRHGGRGHGSPRRLDRDLRRPGRWRRRDPDPRGPADAGRCLCRDQLPSQPRQGLLDHRRE